MKRVTRGARQSGGAVPLSVEKAIRLVRILDAQIPTVEPTSIIEVTSERGYTGMRVMGTTDRTPWSVDLYGGNCYIVRVHGYEPERVDTPLRVVQQLKAKL